MEISTEIGSFLRYGNYKEILTLLKDSGFTAYDFSMEWEGLSSKLITSDDYKEQAQALRAFADLIEMKCNQAHAPLTRERLGEYEYGERGRTARTARYRLYGSRLRFAFGKAYCGYKGKGI